MRDSPRNPEEPEIELSKTTGCVRLTNPERNLQDLLGAYDSQPEQRETQQAVMMEEARSELRTPQKPWMGEHRPANHPMSQQCVINPSFQDRELAAPVRLDKQNGSETTSETQTRNIHSPQHQDRTPSQHMEFLGRQGPGASLRARAERDDKEEDDHDEQNYEGTK